MSIDTFRYDSADDLETDEAITEYAEEVTKGGHADLLQHAAGVVIRAYGPRIQPKGLDCPAT